MFFPYIGRSILVIILLSGALPLRGAEAGDVGEPAFGSGITAESPWRPLSSPIFHDHGDPTAHEQLMLELVNRARANPGAEAARLGIDLNQGLNPGTIEDTPKQPLAFHPALIDAARGHSQWMLDTDTFSHTGVDGTNPGARMSAAGYPFSGSWTWGENIAWGGSSGPVNFTASTIARHEGLFRSPPHRTSIANDAFDEVGIGLIGGTFTTDRSWNAVMATQKFARTGATPGPLLVGVVFHDADSDGLYSPGEGVAGVTVTMAGGVRYTVTSASGGYAVPYPTGGGPLQVTFSGGPLPEPRTLSVGRTGKNLKLDLDLSLIAGPVAFVPGTMHFTEATGLRVEVTGDSGSFNLQHSTNLVDWVTAGTYTIGAEGSILVTHQPPNPTGGHFYRVRR